MKVEVVLTEADLAQEFTDAFEARDLPEKFFYWFPRSAADWTALAADRTFTAAWRRPGRSWDRAASNSPRISTGACP